MEKQNSKNWFIRESWFKEWLILDIFTKVRYTKSEWLGWEPEWEQGRPSAISETYHDTWVCDRIWDR